MAEKVDYAALKKGGFMRQKAERLFFLKTCSCGRKSDC